jgi:antitoxin MazE
VKTRIARWGNSLGVRIPSDIAGKVGLADGATVEIEAKGDRVVISPAQPRYKLEDLLVGMTPKEMRKAFDWGPDRGREVVD